ncbi:MAG: hypothetical protein K6G10_13570 [Butyrivibrio sp.]|nr:hypothetical protein [Butyrivibrio sp.]
MDINNSSDNKIKILFRILAILLIIVIIVSEASFITRRKDSQRKYGDYIDIAGDVDVLLLGSSHMMNAVSPAQLFYERGITAYNMAKPGGMLPESYWTYKLARQYGTPKCVVVDLWSLDRDYKYVDVMNGTEDEDDIRNSVSLLHTNMDAWPMSGVKVQAVCDLLSSFKTRAEFLFDFSIYHSRWSDLTKDDFISDNRASDKKTYVLGAEARKEVFINNNMYEPEDKNVNLEGETVSTHYLRKLVEECMADGIDVVLTFMPMGGSYYQDFQAVNYGKEFAQEYGLEFVNLLDQQSQTVIDYGSDMSDDSHVNEFGMYKITSYLGQKLSEYESVVDHRPEEGFDLYKAEAWSWNEGRYNAVLEEDDLYKLLGYAEMVRDTDIAVYIRAGSAAFGDDYIVRQLGKIASSDGIQAAKEEKGPYLLVRNSREGSAGIYEAVGEQQDAKVSLPTGSAEYIGVKDFAGLYPDGDYDNNLLDMEEHYNSQMQIIIYDKDGQIAAKRYYDCDWDS